jgi:hypothetical protein
VAGGWLQRVLQHRCGGRRMRQGKFEEGMGVGRSSSGEGSGGDENQKSGEVDAILAWFGARRGTKSRWVRLSSGCFNFLA